MNEARELGMERIVNGKKIPIGGKGKAFPQSPNDKGRKFLERAFDRGLADPQVFFVANKMVEDGKAPTIDSALQMILSYRDTRLRGMNAYLESSRFELPEDMVEWDPARVLGDHFNRTALTIEGVREWGVNFERLEAPLLAISQEQEPALANIIREFIKHEFGKGGTVPRESAKIAGGLSNYQTVSKLGYSLLSALRNMGQRYVNTISYPLSIQLKATSQFPPVLNLFMKNAIKLKEKIERTGAVRSATFLSEIETDVPGERITRAALKPFTTVETGNQTFTSIVAGMGLERDVELYLKKNQQGRFRKIVDAVLSLGDKSEGAVQRRLKRSQVLDLSNEKLAHMLATQNGKMTPEQVEAAMHRLVNDTQFPVTLATKRIWWSNHPWLRLLFKFKTFGVEQVGLIYDRVLKEAAKGNFAPMVRFVSWTILMGEIYNIVRDLLTGREESVTFSVTKNPEKRNTKDIAWSMLKNLADGGGVGILADITWGIKDFVFGPMGSTVNNTITAIVDTLNRPEQVGTAIRRLISKEVAVTRQIQGVTNRLDKILLNKNNRFFQYHKWRQRTFEYKDKVKTGDTILSGIKKAAIETVEGRTSFKRTDRTLSYEYAAKQITVGDVADAADYLSRLISDAKTTEEKKNLIKGMRLSAKAKSPLGRIAKKDLRNFLSKFGSKDRTEALALQRRWLSDYNRAIGLAFQKSRKQRRAREL